ncbi:MAG TPA: hypothetical protein VFS58_03660 [Steroidobacteraceae bacterium]|nr:hypothetical protein [Steroidobacteraceae bacterium]
MNKYTRTALAAFLLAASFGTRAEDTKKAAVDCTMKFSLSGWSAFYKRADGKGTVTCNNGQTATVKLEARGGGLTAGKSSIENGTGEFSNVKSIEEIFGKYVNAEASAGAVKSSGVQAMTKGEVSLALAGTGRGWDLGFSFGKFTIKRAE